MNFDHLKAGSQSETLSVRVERLQTAGKDTDPVPGSWVQSSWSASSPVPAGQSANISLELVPPASAKPGSYASDIVVTGSTGATGGNVRFGAAAATGLDFRITPVPPGALPAWKLWLIVALIVIGAAFFSYRRLGLRVRIERQGRTERQGGNFGT